MGSITLETSRQPSEGLDQASPPSLYAQSFPDLADSSKARREHARSAFRNSDPDMNQVLGFHGTSIFALHEAIIHGYLPTRDAVSDLDEIEMRKAGSIFFYPNLEQLSPVLPGGPRDTPKDLLVNTSIYAGLMAERHFLAHAFGLDLGEWKTDRILADIVLPLRDFDQTVSELSRKIHRRRDYILDAVERSKSSKGIILLLDKSISDQFEILAGDPGEPDLKIFVPEGLPLQLVTGIRSLGGPEQEYLEQL